MQTVKKSLSRRFGRTLAAGWVLLFATTMVMAEEPNLLSNGNFESGSGSPSVWYTFANGGNPSFTWPTNMYISATHSVRVYNPTSVDCGDWRQLVTGLNSNTRYRFHSYVYSTNPTGSSIQFHWYNGNTFLSHVVYPVPLSYYQWTQFSVDNLQPPAGADRVFILLLGGGAGSFNFDDAYFGQTVAPSQQPNLIYNGDFESPCNGYQPVWYTAASSGNPSFSSTTSKYVSATHSIKIYNAASTDSGDWRQLVTGLNSNNRYRFRTYVYATNTTGCCIQFHWYNGDNYLSYANYPITQANQWVEFVQEDMQPPAGADRVYILMRGSGAGSYYFDDTVLCRKDENVFAMTIGDTLKFPIGLFDLTSGELLYNGDFGKLDLLGTLPGAWTTTQTDPNNSAATFSMDSSTYHSQSPSVKTVMNVNGQGEWRQLVTNLNSSWTYNLSAWVNASRVDSGSHSVVLQWYSNTGYICSNSYSSTTAKQWVNVTANTIAAPAGATKVWVVLRANKTGNYYFDEVSLQVNMTFSEGVTEAKDAGFNFIDCYSEWGTLDAVNQAGAAGMKVGYVMGGWGGDAMYLDPSDPDYATKVASLQGFVNSVDTNNAIALWRGCDEPAWAGFNPQGIVNAYNVAVAADDNYTTAPHKVWVNHAPRGFNSTPDDFTTLQPYVAGCDIISIDIYPVPENNGHPNLANKTISCVGEYVDILYNQVVNSNGRQSKPIWMVLQGCGEFEFPGGSTNYSWQKQGIEIHWLTGAGGYISREVISSYIPNQWFYASRQNIHPPTNAAYACVLLRTYNQGVFYFDDLSLGTGTSNILNNPGFETEPNSTSDWDQSISSGIATHSWDTTVYSGGSHSVKTVMSSYTGQADWRQRVTIDPSKTYNLSGWIRADIRPTWTQTRFMAYNAIIHGARGIVYWGTRCLPSNADLWTDLKRIAGELDGISSALISHSSFRKVVVSDDSIETLLLNGSDGLYLLAANRTNSAVNNVTMTIGGRPLRDLTRIAGESGSLTLTNNALTDNFSGYQVHVYKFLEVDESACQEIAGDANCDGVVDVGDLGILAANYGRNLQSQNIPSEQWWGLGDFNKDGVVDVGDLGILAAHYGEGAISTLDFNTDYSRAFGTVTDESGSREEVSDENGVSVCSGLGLSLMAGLILAYAMLVKLDEQEVH
jgi:hypothetical protein